MWIKPKIASSKETDLLAKLAAKAQTHADGHDHAI
jgi:hypothetical protein